MDIQFVENGIYLHIHVTDDGDVRLYNLSAVDTSAEAGNRWFRLVEVQGAGYNQNDHHGSKHTGTQPGSLLRYACHGDTRNDFGRKIEITQQHNGLAVTSHLQFYDGIQTLRSWTTLSNHADRPFMLEYISSLALTGLTKASPARRDEGSYVHIPHSTWFGEAQWKRHSVNALGYDVVNDFSMKRISLTSTGSWPCSEHLPMGCFESEYTGESFTWQIETSASWHWEISDIGGQFYLQLSGPSYQEHQFLKSIAPGETFESVPCALAVARGGIQEGIRALTRYRRIIRRMGADNERPSVIFNDYMNCLMGDPTTEKLMPLIDAAAEVGCRYFCIDAGWYSDGEWWDGVGEWLPSKARFPGGIMEPIRRIREKGMIPGLWLEPEVMGIHCPLAEKVPGDWFFQRNGHPVIDHGRYQLDFRNTEVTAYLDRVIDRPVREYGVGYIKMDYNINAGTGTRLHADSPGDGLLQHTRAYLDWLQGVLTRYPDLVLENCSSGGMRMEYSLLSHYAIQSVTDQTDYLKMAAIACNCMTAVTPEQAAIWSYPLADGDEEETAFNMVSAMLLRIHQSGHLSSLSPERLGLVRDGIACHLSIADDVKTGVPFWPIGLATMRDDFMSVGVDCGNKKYLAVWCAQGGGKITLPLEGGAVRCIYPTTLPTEYALDTANQTLTLRMRPGTARLFEVDC